MNKIYLTLLSVIFLALSGYSQCTNLFFSEYIEGSSNNKALEIFNPTTASINLATYKVLQYRNGGSTPANSISLSGTLAPSGTFVLCHPSANATIKGLADLVSGNVSFNGDDALVLVNGTDTLDIIGVRGDSAIWTVDTGNTLNHTLIRKPTVSGGNTNWAVAATEWSAYGVDYTGNLGSHLFNLCAASVDTALNFNVSALTVLETVGTFQLKVVSSQTVATSKTVTVNLGTMSTGGTTADINNFSSAVVTIPAGSNMGATTITVTDDALTEGLETFQFNLASPGAGTVLGTQNSFTLSISANDSAVALLPFYPVGVITTTNSTTFEVDSANVRCRTSGVVYGVDYNKGTGLEYYISDHTGWIRCYSSTRNYGYTVTEGDSVWVQGRVTQYQGAVPTGMTQLLLDTTVLVSSGNVLQAPKLISGREFRDEDESHLVRVENLTYQSGWTNTGSGFTVKAVSTTDNTKQYSIRIDSVTTAYTLPAPTTAFNVVGLVTQYDTSSPYNFYYQVKPRYAADISVYNGINDNNNLQLDAIFYPNPANNVLKYNVVVENNNPIQYNFLTIQGKAVLSGKIEVSEGQNYGNIQLSDLANGIYLLQLTQNGKSKTIKVSVIK